MSTIEFQPNSSTSFNPHEKLELEHESEDFLQKLWADIAIPVAQSVALVGVREYTAKPTKTMWVPVARSSGFVLLDDLILVRAGQAVEPRGWSEHTKNSMDRERFSQATGLKHDEEINAAVEQAALSIVNSGLTRYPGKGLIWMGQVGILAAKN